MKNRKILGSLFIFMIMLLLGNLSFADATSDFSYQDYLKGVKEGWISKNLSYQELVNINKNAEIHFNEKNFTKVYEIKNFQDFDDFKNGSIVPLANVNKFYPGDVFIMNSKASSGLSGHSAMALSNVDFISIHGKGSNPVIFDREGFKKNYGGRTIKVYRSNNYYWGVAAAQWADKTYRNNEKKFTYAVEPNLDNIYRTYCSKMIYHSYLYGAGKQSTKFVTDNFKIIHPYLLDWYIKIGKHGEYDGYSK